MQALAARAGRGRAPATGIAAVVETLLSSTPRIRLLVSNVLPRANLSPWPPQPTPGRTIRQIAQDHVHATNAALRRGLLEGARFAAARADGRLAVADCTAPFRPAVNSWSGRVPFKRSGAPSTAKPIKLDINTSLLPDGLHPSLAGYALLFDCWEQHLAALDARTST